MNADEPYRTGHQGRLRGLPHGEKRDDFRKEDHKTKSMNDDEPFEIHRTGHRGRLLCLMAIEYSQNNKLKVLRSKAILTFNFVKPETFRAKNTSRLT